MRLFAPGDHLITGFDLYGGSFRLFRTTYEPLGLTFTPVHTSDLKAVEEAITPATRGIYLETPTNPTMEITDLEALSDLAHRHQLLVIVDNTFLSPCFQRPLTLGCGHRGPQRHQVPGRPQRSAGRFRHQPGR